MLQKMARAQELLEYERSKARKARRAEKQTRKRVVEQKLLEIQQDTHLAKIYYAIGSDSNPQTDDGILIPKETPNLVPPSPQAVHILTTLLKSPNTSPACAKPTSSIVSQSPPASAATCLSSASAASATPTSATVSASTASDSRRKSNLAYHYKGDANYIPNILFNPR